MASAWMITSASTNIRYGRLELAAAMFLPCAGPLGGPGLLTIRAPAASAMLRVESVEPSSKTINSSAGSIAVLSALRHSAIVASALYAGTMTETGSRTGSGFCQHSLGLQPLGILRGAGGLLVGLRFLVIFLLDVHRPEVVALSQDVLHREHCGQHRMVLVVVAVHAVAADDLQVREIVEPLADDAKSVAIMLVIDRIGLGLADHGAIDDFGIADEVQRAQLPLRLSKELLVALGPELVTLIAEIFHADARVVGIWDQLLRPGTEVLDPSDLHLGRVDVDPIVREQVPLLEDQRNDEEIAVAQPGGRIAHRRRRRRDHVLDELRQRHRGNELVGAEHVAGTVMSVLDLDGTDRAVVAVDLLDALLHAHLAALFGDAVTEGFPHHSRAEPRVVELLDQARRVV